MVFFHSKEEANCIRQYSIWMKCGLLKNNIFSQLFGTTPVQIMHSVIYFSLSRLHPLSRRKNFPTFWQLSIILYAFLPHNRNFSFILIKRSKEDIEDGVGAVRLLLVNWAYYVLCFYLPFLSTNFSFKERWKRINLKALMLISMRYARRSSSSSNFLSSSCEYWTISSPKWPAPAHLWKIEKKLSEKIFRRTVACNSVDLNL